MASLAEEAESSIKEMKLYQHFERVDRELAAAGIDEGSPLTAEDLYPFDSMHYGGVQAVQEAIDLTGVFNEGEAETWVLDIGSGLGGPARYMASENTACHVVALELQDDCHEKANEYTVRCGLSERVHHVCGDILADPLPEYRGSFHLVASWLVFLHISDKVSLFQKCAAMLRSDGILFMEDFYMKSDFTHAEQVSLGHDVFCSGLPSQEDYILKLTEAGFTDIEFTDLTEMWTAYVINRTEIYESSRDRILELHGAPTFESQLHFFRSMSTLFTGGNLGGARIKCRRI